MVTLRCSFHWHESGQTPKLPQLTRWSSMSTFSPVVWAPQLSHSEYRLLGSVPCTSSLFERTNLLGEWTVPNESLKRFVHFTVQLFQHIGVTERFREQIFANDSHLRPWRGGATIIVNNITWTTSYFTYVFLTWKRQLSFTIWSCYHTFSQIQHILFSAVKENEHPYNFRHAHGSWYKVCEKCQIHTPPFPQQVPGAKRQIRNKILIQYGSCITLKSMNNGQWWLSLNYNNKSERILVKL